MDGGWRDPLKLAEGAPAPQHGPFPPPPPLGLANSVIMPRVELRPGRGEETVVGGELRISVSSAMEEHGFVRASREGLLLSRALFCVYASAV